jgi:acetoin utilization deacetylase AcuC-like enzyme
MGFCLLNNIAIAAAHAIAEHGLQRVLIIDWDVHHGNGTQHAFEHRSDVLMFDVHQHPLYPNSGMLDEVGFGEGEGFTVNAPLPAGMDDAAYVELFRTVLVPIADAYRPQLVLVSAGFDAHERDPLAEMHVTERGYAALCGIACEIAGRHCEGRLATLLEGGYDLQGLASSVLACVEVLEDSRTPPEIPAPHARARGLISDIREFHSQFWPVLK